MAGQQAESVAGFADGPFRVGCYTLRVRAEDTPLELYGVTIAPGQWQDFIRDPNAPGGWAPAGLQAGGVRG